MTSVTVFYNDRLWMAGEPCYDYRVDAQILPAGSVVVGIAVRGDDGEISSLFRHPYLIGEQINHAEETRKEALALFDMW